MKEVAQICLLVFVAVAFFVNIYRDINGRPAREPEGFSGVVTTILATAFALALYYFAGALSIFF